jgi:hypothetical protein
MKSKVLIPLVAGVALVGGFLLGRWQASNSWGRFFDSYIQQRESVDVSQHVRALTCLRQGRQDDALMLLETYLDGSLVTFSTFDKADESVSRAVAVAREYRQRYPWKSSRASIDQVVQEVFENIGPKPSVAVREDGRVLDALMLHLLADPKFDVTRVDPKGGMILLDASTPEGTGFLQAHQIRGDIGDHTLPPDAEDDLRRRNTPADAKPDTYDSVRAFYTNLTFSTGIVVTNLSSFGEREHSINTAFPTARGWLDAYLPGYSKDGLCAVVRAGVEPSPHGAMVTALLRKQGDRWVVEWYHVAYYV